METNTVTEIDELALPEGFSANSGGSNKFEYRKLKPADDVIYERLLPQWGSLRAKGDIGVYSKLHYGWKVRDAANPTKIVNRTFLCIEEKKNGMTTVECPACTLIKSYIAKFESLKVAEAGELAQVRAEAQKRGLNEEQTNKAIGKIIDKYKNQKKDVTDWLKAHNTGGKFRMHTINKTGALGVLALPYGLSKKLKKKIEDVEARDYPASIAKGRKVKVSANGMYGVFFKISRKGQASKESDDVEVNKIVNDDGSEMIDYHKITREFLEMAEKTLPDLVQMAEDTRLTANQIQQLVDHCVACGGSCDPDEVGKIMGPRPSAKPVAKTEPVKAEVKVVEQPKAEPKVEPKAESKPAQEPIKASENMADASDEQFDALFGDN